MINVIVLHENDNVGVTPADLKAGERFKAGHRELEARGDVPQCHKVALAAMAASEPILKYGEFIGVAARAIQPGEHVHSHNLRPEDPPR